MRADACPRRPTGAHISQHKPNTSPRWLTTANAGPQKPTQACDGSRQPTQAHEDQCRLTKANEGICGPKRRDTVVWAQVCFHYLLFITFANIYIVYEVNAGS